MVDFSFSKKNIIGKTFSKLKNLTTFNKLEISILVGFILSLLIFSVFSNFLKNCENIRNNTLRLHIKANSDNKIDQSLKLKVKNEVVEKTSYIFKNSNSKEDSKGIIKENLNYIENIAQQKVLDEGFNYKVTAEIKPTYFNTRIYENFTMPAGTYDALSIDIGTGNGQNWWCVLYPPLCLPSATKVNNDDVIEKNYTNGEIDILENKPKYEFKFKFVEIFEGIKNFFTNL